MQIPQIKIDFQFGQLGLKIDKPKLEIKPATSSIEINNPAVEIKLDKKESEIEIDHSPSNYDLGFKSIDEFAKDKAQAGKKTVSNKIQSQAQHGDKLMAIENPNNRLIDVIKEETRLAEKEIGLAWQRTPNITFSSQQLKVIHKPQEPVINFIERGAEFDLKWGKVAPRVIKKPYIDIRI